MSWVWIQAWKHHFHMERIKRSTVLQSQQLDLDMLGYTQPALAGKWSPFPLFRQWRLWKMFCESAFYPGRQSWTSSLELPRQTARESRLWSEKWEKSVFSIWRERCSTITLTNLRTSDTFPFISTAWQPHIQVRRRTDCKSDKCVPSHRNVGMLSTLLSAAPALDSIIKLH